MITGTNHLVQPGVRPRREWRKAGADRWLSLAAAPTFAIMALFTAISESVMPDVLCSATHGASRLNGMVAMYLLMTAFHLAPWLRLIANMKEKT